MRTLSIGLLALILSPVFEPEPSAASPVVSKVDSLAWLSGTWIGKDGPVEIEEVWMAPKGGTMVGMHRDVHGDKTVGFEFLMIAMKGDDVAYIAQPGGGPKTTFLMKESSERRVVFANEQHDFPKRILYWIDGDGALHARIEGDEGGPQPMEWTWRRPEVKAAKDTKTK